jgi:hypothetical protein
LGREAKGGKIEMSLETKLRNKIASGIKTTADIGMALLIPSMALVVMEKYMEKERKEDLANGIDRSKDWKYVQDENIGLFMMAGGEFLRVATYVYLAVNYFKQN